jgi:4-diphosphocytidyl-2-C-methyl-D-erythritol kinase
MSTATAPAKINLALVVGPRREDGKHEVVTVYERIDLADTLRLEPSDALSVEGFPADTLVARALRALADRTGVVPGWRVTLEKRIPVASGLGGGSSDAATALRLANASLATPLGAEPLRQLAAELGADVPFFLAPGPHLGQGDGTSLTPLTLPQDYWVLVLLPAGSAKHSTKSVYDAFDDRQGEVGFAERRADLLGRLREVRNSGDLSAWPLNDLASSTLTPELSRLGAFRADVSGAGPALYGLFERAEDARRAAAQLEAVGQSWVTFPTWYG